MSFHLIKGRHFHTIFTASSFTGLTALASLKIDTIWCSEFFYIEILLKNIIENFLLSYSTILRDSFSGGRLELKWHHDEKEKNKINSVNDFIKSANYLIDHLNTNSFKLVIGGFSSSGIIMGRALAIYSEFFHAA